MLTGLQEFITGYNTPREDNFALIEDINALFSVRQKSHGMAGRDNIRT
jgi:hypothetical protein